MLHTSRLYYFIAKSPLGNFFRRWAPEDFDIILAYHSVDKDIYPYSVSKEKFIKQMSYIKKFGNVVSLPNLIEGLSSSKSRRNIAVTFDDGYANMEINVIPILAEMDIPATIYIPVKYMGKFNEWDTDKSVPSLSILSGDQLKRIVRENNDIEIGSHGNRHIRLAGLSKEMLDEEILGSKKRLEDMLGVNCRSIAYPYGGLQDYDTRVIEKVQKSNYSFGLSSRFGRRNTINERFHLRRITVNSDDDLQRFQCKLKGNYDWVVGKELLAHNVKQIFSQALTRRKNDRNS